jgi:Protein of unknown function (DUF4239)
MNIYLSGLIWVLGATLVAAGAAILVQRFHPSEKRAANNEAAGYIFTIVGGLHAVLVAFVLITLFDNVGTAAASTTQEADSLVAVSWAADSLPQPVRDQVHALCMAYATTVIRQEWPELNSGRSSVTGPGWHELDQLHTAISAAAVSDTDWQKDQKTEATNQLWQVFQARQQRLDAASGGSVNAVVWFALIAGGVLSAAFAYLFGGARITSHVIIVSTLAATITLLLFAVHQLQDPFTGGAHLGPDSFIAALSRLQASPTP